MKINSQFSSHSLDERLFIASLYERRVLELERSERSSYFSRVEESSHFNENNQNDIAQ